MKLSTCALVGSLATNLLLVGGLAFKARPAKPDPSTTLLEAVPAAPRAIKPTSAPMADPPFLGDLEPATLLAELQQLNYAPEVVQALVKARIYARVDDRRRELMTEVARRPWWEAASRVSLLTPAQRSELREMAAAARNETLRLLGPDALDPEGRTRAQYAYVAPERAVTLEAIIRDYDDLQSMLRDDMRGLRTKADRDREAVLQQEKERDIAALLTPRELELFRLRTSVAAATMRPALLVFEPTETEYRKIHEIIREFHESHPGRIDIEGRDQPISFLSYPEYGAKIREQVGEARFADWQLANGYQTAALTRLAPKFDLDAATVRQTAQQLREVARQSQAIWGDRNLTTAQKRIDLQSLAQSTRDLLTAAIGEEATNQFLTATPLEKHLARGYSIEFTETGGLYLSGVQESRSAPIPSGTTSGPGLPTSSPSP